MKGFASIVGQEGAVSRLRSALASGKAHHAYLFDGPEGIGKRTTAIALAQALNCDEAPGEGCGECASCRKIEEGTHPDLVLFRVFNEEGKEKGQTERVRELIGSLAFPPHEGHARVVIVDPAHDLNATASNVILKTLEEPPSGTYFVLVTTTASRLLVTIRSRCQRLSFAPLAETVIAETLVAAHELDPKAAQAAARLAAGSLGKALELASSEELPRRRERAGRVIAAARARKAQAALEIAAELSGDRDEAMATLELVWLAYHDALIVQQGAGSAAVAVDEVAKLAARVRPRSLLTGLRAVEEASDALRGYVSPQLALERLVLQLGHAGAA